MMKRRRVDGLVLRTKLITLQSWTLKTLMTMTSLLLKHLLNLREKLQVVNQKQDGKAMKAELEKKWDHFQHGQRGLNHQGSLILILKTGKFFKVLEEGLLKAEVLLLLQGGQCPILNICLCSRGEDNQFTLLPQLVLIKDNLYPSQKNQL